MKQDKVYQAALERLNALNKEREELEQFLATYRKLSGDDDHVKVVTHEIPIDTRGPDSPENRWTTERIVDAAMKLLSDKGPLPLATIHDGLVARGVVIGGKKPRQNLGAKLSADFRLKSVKGRGWWFSDERPPPMPSLPPLVELKEPDEERYARWLDGGHNAEGPTAFAEEPSQLNGTAGYHPA